MSIVAQVIAQSDAADRFLSSAEIAKLEDFFSKVKFASEPPKS